MPAAPPLRRSPLITFVRRDNGKPGPRFNFHAGQQQAWRSNKRVVLVLAGVRSGKTSFGPLWLYREMCRQGPGDYLVAAPTFPLINKAAGPELERVFSGLFRLGAMSHSPWEYRLSQSGHQRMWPSQPWPANARHLRACELFGIAGGHDCESGLAGRGGTKRV